MHDDTADTYDEPWMGLLRRAAAAWLDEHPPPSARESYSSVANRFLWAAERAWFDDAAIRQLKRELVDVATTDGLPHRGFFVYRLWASDKRLLYVGSTTRLRARLGRHRAKLDDLIDDVTWQSYDDARSMLDAERDAIANEYPALNVAGV